MQNTAKTSLSFENLFSYLEKRFTATELCDRLDITQNDLHKLKHFNFDARLLHHVSRRCNFSMNSAIKGTVLLEPIIKRLEGEIYTTPQKYLDNAYTSRKVVERIASLVPNKFLNNILAELQVSKEFIFGNNSKQFVSTQLTHDLTQKIGKIRDISLLDIGVRSAKSNVNTIFSSEFTGLDAKSSYEIFVQELIGKYFEKSHIYNIEKLTSSELVLHKHYSKEVESQININEHQQGYVCDYIMGFIGTIPHFVGGNAIMAKETKCIFRGDDYCEYRFHYSKTKQQQSRFHYNCPAH